MPFLVQFIDLLATVLSLAIIARVVITWIRPDPYNPIVQVVMQFTEPVLAPIRNLMPGSMGGLDFSPMIALIVIQIVQSILRQALR